MFAFHRVRTIVLVLGFAFLVIAFASRLQAWQTQPAEQAGNIESLALATETSHIPPITPLSTEEIITSTPFPLPMAVNAEGTPFNPVELTPMLTLPAVNAEGTPLTPTPNINQADFTGTPRPMPTLTPGGPPTPTPVSYVTKVDLAEGLPDGEVWRIVVLRTDGNLDEYRVPAAQVRPLLSDSTNGESYLAFRDTLFQLKSGEMILYENLMNAPVKAVPLGVPTIELTDQAEIPIPESTSESAIPEQSEAPSQLHLPEVEN